MWFLALLPTAALTSFVNLVLVAGVLGLVGSFFLKNPLMFIQKTALQIVSIVVLVLGVYWYGGINIEKEWRAKVEASEQRALIAEGKAKEATARVEYVFQDKVKVVKEVQIIVQEKIRDVSVLIDSKCQITKETVDILNEAARNKTGAKK
jgi:hypothetical protein